MSQAKFRILSIDGGGIRGILPGQVLVALEDRLRRESGDADARIADFFDLIAGTSTGGILASLLLTPDPYGRARFTAEEAVELYMKRGPEIFDVPLHHRIRTAGGIADEKYPSKGIENVLDEYFGNLRLSELLKPCLITSYDIRRRQVQFFTQHDTRVERNGEAHINEGEDFLVKDVCRATSAAPTYFEASRIESMSGVPHPLIDGGIFANNPSMCAYAEVREHFKRTAGEMAILSLGTGAVSTPYDHSEAKDWGAIAWIRPLIDIMMSAVADTVHFQLEQIYAAVATTSEEHGGPQLRGNQYLRINPSLQSLPEGVTSDMDDASETNLAGLRAIGVEVAEKHARDLDAFVGILLEGSSEPPAPLPSRADESPVTGS